MNKTQTATHYSLRCKFKDSDTVELTVVNHDNGATYQLRWTFADLTAKPITEKLSKGGESND